MRLAIADPPYLPGPAGHSRASRHYAQTNQTASMTRFGHGRTNRAAGDDHPDAFDWDVHATHAAMCRYLRDNFDGYAVAMMPNNLRAYLGWLPPFVRVAVWHKTNPVPTGNRVTTAWEPVCIVTPPSRLSGVPRIPDVLTCPTSVEFVGGKPRPWTRWVLDMLGYEPDTDSVDDLFGGSGAVSAEIRQGTLL